MTPSTFDGPGVGDMPGEATANPGASAIRIASTTARLTADTRLVQEVNFAVVTGSPVLCADVSVRADVSLGLIDALPLQPILVVGASTKLRRLAPA